MRKLPIIIYFFLFSLTCFGNNTNFNRDTLPPLNKDTTIVAIATNYALTQKNIDVTTQKIIENENSIIQKSTELENLNEQIKNIERQKKVVGSELLRQKKDLSALLDNFQILKLKFENDKIKYANQKSIDSFKLDSIQHSLIKLTDSLKIKKDSLDVVTAKISQSNEVYNNVKTQYEALKNSDSLEIIATIELKNKDQKLVVYNSKSKLEDSAKIINVHLFINEGLITDVMVITDKGNFRNKKAPIDLVHFNETRQDDQLEMEGKNNESIFIKIGDVIKYTTNKTYRNIPYLFKEINLTLKDPITFLKESTSINSYLEAGTFTDLQGINGKANALVEANASLKFILRTENSNNKAVIWFNYLKIIGGISKFDDKYKGTPYTTKDTISRIDLLQRTKDKIGIKFNLIHWLPSPYPKRLIDDIEINIGYFYSGSNLLTTTYKDVAQTVLDTSYTRVVQNSFLFEPTVSLSRNSAIGATISLPFYFQNIKNNAAIANKEWLWYFAPSLTLYYSSKKTPGNKLFFKYVSFTDLKNPKNGFSQAQIGYSANFTEIFKLK